MTAYDSDGENVTMNRQINTRTDLYYLHVPCTDRNSGHGGNRSQRKHEKGKREGGLCLQCFDSIPSALKFPLM